jgi:hypothetical protein
MPYWISAKTVEGFIWDAWKIPFMALRKLDFILASKNKVVPVLNKLSTTPWRRMGEWMYRSTFSWPRHLLEVSDQLHARAALPPGKEPPVSIGYEVGWTPEPVWTTWRRENSWPYRNSELRPLGRPTRSQSLYRLRYPGSLFWPLRLKYDLPNSFPQESNNKILYGKVYGTWKFHSCPMWSSFITGQYGFASELPDKFQWNCYIEL